MAKKSETARKRGRPRKDGGNRVTVSMPEVAHARLVEFCSSEYDVGATAGDLIQWILEQDQGTFAMIVRNRRRVDGSETLRAAFCDVLKSFAVQVCGGKPDGVRHLLHSDLEPANPSR